jgi:hypothetical protein
MGAWLKKYSFYHDLYYATSYILVIVLLGDNWVEHLKKQTECMHIH